MSEPKFRVPHSEVSQPMSHAEQPPKTEKEISVKELAEVQDVLADLLEQLEVYTTDPDWYLRVEYPDSVLARFLYDHRGMLAKGLHYKATRAATLSVIVAAQKILRTTGGENSDFVLDVMSSNLMDQTQYIEEELNHERDDTQDLGLLAMSGLLTHNMSLHQQNTHAEQFLLKHLALLQESLYQDFDKLGESHIVKAWQNLLLQLGNSHSLTRACKALQLIWEAHPKKDWNALATQLFGPVVDEFSQETETNRAMVVKTAIDMAGLNGLSLLKKWMQVGDPRNPDRDAYMQNLGSLYALKQRSPEAPKELYERFGIAHFGRYTTDMLERQFEERDAHRPYGIVLFPYADHNGAFFQDKHKLDALQKSLQFEAHNGLRVVEAGSRAEVAGAIMRLDRAYGQGEDGNKIAFAIVGGHGTRDSIQFGDSGKLGDKILLDDIGGKRLTQGAQSYFAPGASIILFSCSTGAKAGIAEEMKNKYGWNLIAPDKPSSVDDIELRVDWNGSFSFDVTYSNETKDVQAVQYKPSEKRNTSGTP